MAGKKKFFYLKRQYQSLSSQGKCLIFPVSAQGRATGMDTKIPKASTRWQQRLKAKWKEYEAPRTHVAGMADCRDAKKQG